MATLFRSAILISFTTLAAWPHAISVSTGEAKLEKRDLFLTVKIPPYEAEHLGKSGGGTAAEAVGRAFSFPGARLLAQTCTGESGEMVCLLNFLFEQTPGERMEAEVRLARETVPNHVHILRIKRGSVERQTIFDRTFEREAINFHEPSAMETWSKGMQLGAGQLLYQPLLLAMLATIALLGRPWVYLPVSVAAFLAVLPDKFYATPAFFELASAIGLAYFALEGYFFPNAKGRWMPLGVLGAVEGAALAVLARPTANAAVSYGLGNILAQCFVLVVAAAIAVRIPETWKRYALVAMALLGVVSTATILLWRF
jgi:hypothetical protein